VATTIRVTELASATRRHTRSIMVLPARTTSGLPGKRVEAKRAGMIARTSSRLGVRLGASAGIRFR
jgi:hypothetical protein